MMIGPLPRCKNIFKAEALESWYNIHGPPTRSGSILLRRRLTTLDVLDWAESMAQAGMNHRACGSNDLVVYRPTFDELSFRHYSGIQNVPDSAACMDKILQVPDPPFMNADLKWGNAQIETYLGSNTKSIARQQCPDGEVVQP
jgi:hypothetical protein